MHARTFLCREALWEAFEQIAREQGTPIDELLAEAMRAYARQRSYDVGDEPVRPGDPGPHDYASEDGPDLARTGAHRPATHRMSAPTGEAPVLRRPATSPLGGLPRTAPIATVRGGAPPPVAPPPRGPTPLPEAPSRGPMHRPFAQPSAPPPPARGARAVPSGAGPLPVPPSRQGPSSSGRSMPPPLPASDPYVGAAPVFAAARGRAVALTLTHLGRTVDVTKERFIIGRSRSQADLVLDDPNVSRQHAAIERVGDVWYLADLGSTNGCYVDGQRVSRRPIADGDVIEITTHQVRCALR